MNQRCRAASSSSPAQPLTPNFQTQLLFSPFRGHCSLRGLQSSRHLRAQDWTSSHTRASVRRANPGFPGHSDQGKAFPKPSTQAQALAGVCGPCHHASHQRESMGCGTGKRRAHSLALAQDPASCFDSLRVHLLLGRVMVPVPISQES